MARARNIKPGLYKNEELAQCSMAARYLFPALWCLADCTGLLEDRPRRIKAEIMPYDEVDVDELLEELQTHGFIQRYEAEGVRCIWVVNFSKHQNPHIREKQKGSTLPPPPVTNIFPRRAAEPAARPERCRHGTGPADSGNPIPPPTDPDMPNPESGAREGTVPGQPHKLSPLVKSLYSAFGEFAFSADWFGQAADRIVAVTGEPHWRAWWAEVLRRMHPCENAMTTFLAKVEYAEKCADPEQRRAKDLGELKRPGAYLVRSAMDLCKHHRIRWPKFPGMTQEP